MEARCRHLTLPAGAYLYHEGQTGDAVYVLVSGRSGVWSGGERGEPTLLAILGPGEMFGEMAILSDERVRTAGAQALSRVEVIQIMRSDIESLRQRYPRIAECVLGCADDSLFAIQIEIAITPILAERYLRGNPARRCAIEMAHLFVVGLAHVPF